MITSEVIAFFVTKNGDILSVTLWHFIFSQNIHFNFEKIIYIIVVLVVVFGYKYWWGMETEKFSLLWLNLTEKGYFL